jgi:WD40 repeat protein
VAEQERTQAQVSEQRAKQAEATQAQLRARAEDQEQQARRSAYASDINLAQQALAIHNLGRAQELLNRQRPRAGAPDLRGWEWRYLWSQCRSDALFSLCQLSNSVQSLAISPDGRFLIAGEQEHGGASVWDLRTRKELVRLGQGEYRVQVAFSTTCELAACSSQGPQTNRVRLWSAATRQVVGEFGLNGLCLGLRFSDDGKTLLTATGEPDHKLTLWRVPDGTRVAAYNARQANGSIGTPFAATGDLKVAFYRLNDGLTVCALDLVSGQELWRARPGEAGTTCLAVSPDGRLLAVGCGILDSTIRLLDAQTGHPIRRLEGHRGYVIAMAFGSDNNTLYSGSADQTIRMWDVAKPADATAGRVLIGHKLEVWSLAAQPNSPMLASGSKDGVINIWDTTLQARKQAHQMLTSSCEVWAFSGQSNSMVTVSPKGRVLLWQPDDLSTNEILFELGPVSPRRCISRDARLVASGESDGSVAVWDVDRRLRLPKISAPFGPAAPVEFCANNRLLFLVRFSDFSLHLWDLNAAQEIPLHFPSMKNETLQDGDAGALSRDGQWALLVSGRGAGWLFDLEKMRTEELSLDLKQPADAAFSPDSSMFAVASRLGYVRLWETGTRRELGTLRGVLLGLHSVAFSPDGQRLAAGSNRREAIKLWDLQSQQELLTLEGEGSVFYSAAFSPDGSTLGAVNSSHRLNLWTTPTWSMIESAER